jgi:superfamily II DNA/RNA helicase
LDSFRSGEAKLLIASDVAARGLDIPDVSHIFNFDVPHHADDYVHRIGRTGRAGKTGTAYTIVGPGDSRAVAEIEKLIGQSIPWADALPVDGSAADAPPHADSRHESREPRREGRGGSRNRHRSHRNEPRAPREERVASDQAQAPQPHTPHAQAPQAQAPRREQRQPAPVARIEEARHRQAPARPREPADHDSSHLPAFLLRPVRGKA